MLQLEESRRKFEEDREKERRLLDERLDQSQKELFLGLESERREWERASGRWPNRLIWAAIILAIAEVGAAIVSLPAITRALGFD